MSLADSAVSSVGSMKSLFSSVCLAVCLALILPAPSVKAASVQEKPAAKAAANKAAPVKKAVPAKKATPVKKAAPVTKNAPKVKKRAPIVSKSKPASEVAKTALPSANLDLSLPRDMVEELEPVGTVALPKRPAVLPQMFGEKASPFQLNGRLISNEMQLQLRNEERREVDGAALEFEFKR